MKKITGVKAFGKGLICKGFQFEENKEFIHEGELNICKSGFHFCENPLDVLNYYDLCDSEFAEVEATGKIVNHNDDSKVATNKLKIGLRIDLKRFVELSIEYIWNKCNKSDEKTQAASGDSSKLAASGDSSKLAASGDYSKLAASGDYSKLAASGYSSQLAASGDSSQLAASGDYSKLAASGDYSKLAASGYYSQLAASGDSSKLAASGDYSKLAASGYYSQLAASGDYSKLAASGDYSKLAITGKNSVGANIGIEGKIKGILGTWITLAEYDNNFNCICVKSIKIDGKKIKADTWYILKNKKFTEIK